jgi:hypothetical protein
LDITYDQIFDALKHPGFLDCFGRLYVLSESGETRFIDPSPDKIKAGFQGYGRLENEYSWLVWDNSVFLLVGNEKHILNPPKNFLFEYIILPSVQPSVLLAKANSREVILANGAGNQVYVIQKDGDVKYEFSASNAVVFDACVADSDLFFVGMSGRKVEAPDESDRSLGAPIIGEYNLDNHNALSVNQVEEDLTSEIYAKFEKKYGRRLPYGCFLECMESVVPQKSDQTVLIGGIVQVTIDTRLGDDLAFYVGPEDYVVTGIFYLDKLGNISVKDVLYPYSFLRRVDIGEEQYIYLLNFQGDNLDINFDAISCLIFKDDGVDEVPIKVNIQGVSTEDKLAYFFPYYDKNIGFYGSIGKYPYGKNCHYFVRSENGLDWRIVHGLIEPLVK